MQQKIELKGKTFEYELKTYRLSRTIRLIIRQDGKFVVTAPRRISVTAIEKFIKAKADWIIAALDRYAKTRINKPIIDTRKEYLKYKEKARALVNERLAHFNKAYGYNFKKISIRNQKTRWGSCSKQGNLNFSYKLAVLPSKLADYIIVHELCHLKEFNHSKRFWALVARTIPDHAVLRRELSKNGVESQIS